jgi:hypothetical protein
MKTLGVAVALRRARKQVHSLCQAMRSLSGSGPTYIAIRVVAHGETTGDVLGEPAKCRRTPIGSSASKAGRPRTRVDADTFGGEMIHDNELRCLTFPGERRRQVGAPHRVHRPRDDGAVDDAVDARLSPISTTVTFLLCREMDASTWLQHRRCRITGFMGGRR